MSICLQLLPNANTFIYRRNEMKAEWLNEKKVNDQEQINKNERTKDLHHQPTYKVNSNRIILRKSVEVLSLFSFFLFKTFNQRSLLWCNIYFNRYCQQTIENRRINPSFHFLSTTTITTMRRKKQPTERAY